MEWTDIKITTTKTHADTAEAIATGISGGGIYIEDYSDLEKGVLEIAHIDLIDEELLQKNRQEVIIHLYLAPDENPAEILDILQGRLTGAEVPYTIKADGVKQEDWETGWKAYYHPIDIGDRLAIVPSWEKYDTNRTIITLDPGMAFGTGTHETTALCLSVLDKIVKGNERMLDIGTGSGILAIAALKLGASSAEGVDIDPMCVRTAGENAALNGVQDKFKVLVGDLSQKASGKYDIICANIVAAAIISLAPSILPLLADDAVFVASGIIDTRKDEVLAALEKAGLAIKTVKEDKGWVCVIAQKL